MFKLGIVSLLDRCVLFVSAPLIAAQRAPTSVVCPSPT